MWYTCIMNDVSRIGIHIGGSEEALGQIPFYHLKWGMRLFQVFASPPRGAYPPQLKHQLITVIKQFPQIRIVFHSPYWVSLLSGVNQTYNLGYVKDLMDACLREQIGFNYVTHIGYPDDRETDYKECQTRIKAFIEKVNKIWPDNLHGIVWLETDSGHRQLWNGYNGLRSLVEIVAQVNDKKFRVCADSEHIYASGEDAPRDSDWDWISLVHLNSIPEEVVKGNHLDRHSFTALKDCKIGDRFVKHYFKNALERKLPIVLERRNLDISYQDYEYLKTLDLSDVE